MSTNQTWQGWEQIPEGYRKQFGGQIIIASKGFFQIDGKPQRYWTFKDCLREASNANSARAAPCGTLGSVCALEPISAFVQTSKTRKKPL